MTHDSCNHRRIALFAVSLLCPIALVVGCGDSEEDVPPGVDAGSSYLLVSNASVDFQSGSFGVVDLESQRTYPDLGPLHSDSVVRATNGYLFGINRLGADNLQRLDPNTFETIWQYSTEPGSNPQDVVVVVDRAYVTRYDHPDLWIVDPDAASASEFLLGTVDLSSFADADGLPEASHLVEVGGLVYISLQRLDRDQGFAPTNDSWLVALDPSTDSFVDLDPNSESSALILPVPNPVDVRVADGVIWLACAGQFGVQDGSIVRYDTSTGSFLADVVTEVALGGDLAVFTPTDPSFVLWSDADFAGTLSAVELSDPTAISVVRQNLDFVQDLAYDNTFIYLPDRTREQPGIRIFNQNDLSETTVTPLSTGLLPWSIEIVEL